MSSINKYMSHAETLMGKKVMTARPRFLQLEPTNRCNQDCIMCSRSEMIKMQDVGDMTLENFKKIVNDIGTLERLQLNGLGEPMINPHTPDMIAYAAGQGIDVSMNTNAAYFVNDDKANAVLDAKLHIMKVSMDSPHKDTYELIRKGPFGPVDKGLRNMVRIWTERGKSQGTGMKIKFNSVIMQQNKHQLEDIVALADELGINQVRFKPVDPFDLFRESGLTIGQDEYKEIFSDLQGKIKKYKVATNVDEVLNNFGEFLRPKSAHPCYAPWRELYVQFYGGARLCCEFYDQSHDVGNLITQSFEEVWNGEKMQHIRDEFFKGNTFFPVCEHCNRFSFNLPIYDKVKKTRKFIPGVSTDPVTHSFEAS